jgi:hypothetical protein
MNSENQRSTAPVQPTDAFTELLDHLLFQAYPIVQLQSWGRAPNNMSSCGRKS